jgi:Holliday junction resolvase RusA-like endonuclease
VTVMHRSEWMVVRVQYKFTIAGRMEGLNEYTAANRTNPHKGGKMKRKNEDAIIYAIRQQLRGVHIDKPVLIYYRFYEPNRRRDNDNILSCAAKFVQDSLKKAWIIKDDGQKYIPKFYFDTFVDAENPRIEVQITELTAEQAKMQLVDLLKDLYWERGD